ncbi:MAG TPA: ABC transporter permease subunit, partial [Micromonosporaceae bacterium]|nr:ABC transporter permease subunit [Micromonosporaceae bacterium]
MSTTTGGPASRAPQHHDEPGVPRVVGTAEPGRQPRSDVLAGTVVKVVLLGLVGAIAVWAAFPLIDTGAWIGLAILVVTTAAIFYLYLTPRHIPAKYLVPGTLFLIAFQVLPVLYTASTAFTNFGDGHRGTKQDAVVAIQTSSVVQVPGSKTYNLSVATTGDPATGPLVFLLTDPISKTVYVGDADGLEELPAGAAQTGLTGKVTSAEGYTILDAGQVSARSEEVTGFVVPVGDGGIRSQGLSRAYEGRANRAYDSGCDCIRDAESGKTWTADPESGSFVAADGERLAQGWKVNVGLDNFTRVLTDENISGPFLRTLVWNFAFAILSVSGTFVLGLLCALAMHSDRIRGRTLYRTLLILPYAMPSFAMLLVWRDMFNTDFGLINRLFGTDVNWFGRPASAMVAVLLVQIWMGYPYMFLVCTGALQAIPADLKEAAAVDGARPFLAFRTVVFPLLLVALAPLMIASFAFNFNNFNAIYLVSEGGPFPADSPQAGATDLLITYTYRIAFGGQGAQYGLAA